MKSLLVESEGTFTQTLDVPLVFHSSISCGINKTPLASVNRKSLPIDEANWLYENPAYWC